ncbi:ATP-binding protein [Sulfuricurvum sp.]|uniref:ATP-binding protein n=1 Tax=Sulfuricurvum sp. TaxID=2025608 RepID=UPI002608B212|nr:ATP-binding protein [Sulfuricurvum sp.]MDD2267677.1 ATP-binding protein [Sulfuricurvum sp.]MDD2784114.1 ATP-binding protein [Sulfuricurvum sp.]
MNNATLSNIHNDYDGFNKLIEFYGKYKDDTFETIEINLDTWFDANLSAVLGGIIDRLNEWNFIEFGTVSPNIQIILKKNRFLAHFGFDDTNDTYHTTIKYLKLKPTDSRYFSNYVQTELFGRNELPNMSQEVRKKISESIFEMFVNAQIHSDTKFIYTCGQFYPQRNEIIFTIVDTGVGFAKRIENNLGEKIPSAKAIKWAITEGHTTKKDTPGGIGLAILKDFITKNKGKIQIISGNAMYQLDTGGEEYFDLDSYFDGVIINMVFKTNDTTSYHFAEEIDLSELF